MGQSKKRLLSRFPRKGKWTRNREFRKTLLMKTSLITEEGMLSKKKKPVRMITPSLKEKGENKRSSPKKKKKSDSL